MDYRRRHFYKNDLFVRDVAYAAEGDVPDFAATMEAVQLNSAGFAYH